MRITRSLLMVTVLLAVLAGCTTHHRDTSFRFRQLTKPDTVIPVSKRLPAGPVQGGLLSGGTYRLTRDRGRVVVLNFWGSWCGPCKVETPELSTLFTSLKPQDVRFVGLDIKDDKGSVQDFVTQDRIAYPIVFDQPARTALQLGHFPDNKVPSTVLIDRKGRVAAVYAGPVTSADLTPVITTLLAEPA